MKLMLCVRIIKVRQNMIKKTEETEIKKKFNKNIFDSNS